MADCYQKKLPSSTDIAKIMSEQGHELLTIKELAFYLRLSPYTIFRLCRDDESFPKKIHLTNSSVRFNRQDVIDWVNKKKGTNNDE